MRLCGKARPDRGIPKSCQRVARWLSNTRMPKDSGSSAGNGRVPDGLKRVWKHGWDAGALASHRNLQHATGSFRKGALSCAEDAAPHVKLSRCVKICGEFCVESGLFRSYDPLNWTVGMSLFLYRRKTTPFEERQMERCTVSFSEGLSRSETARNS
jgi:hypothetical protein